MVNRLVGLGACNGKPKWRLNYHLKGHVAKMDWLLELVITNAVDQYCAIILIEMEEMAPTSFQLLVDKSQCYPKLLHARGPRTGVLGGIYSESSVAPTSTKVCRLGKASIPPPSSKEYGLLLFLCTYFLVKVEDIHGSEPTMIAVEISIMLSTIMLLV
jgi:hypothetical protein